MDINITHQSAMKVRNTCVLSSCLENRSQPSGHGNYGMYPVVCGTRTPFGYCGSWFEWACYGTSLVSDLITTVADVQFRAPCGWAALFYFDSLCYRGVDFNGGGGVLGL